MTTNVVQRVLWLGKEGEKKQLRTISKQQENRLETEFKASERVIAFLRGQAASGEKHEYEDWTEAVNSARTTLAIARLDRARKRNLTRKAKPKRERALLDLQKKHCYSYRNLDIKEGILIGSYHSGRGGQPNLTVNQEDYKGAEVGTRYKEIISVFKRDHRNHSEQQIAEAILRLIYQKEFNEDDFTAEVTRAISTIVMLTQIIEPFHNRIPGADKWARASFSRISNGQSTFEAEFNRKTANYTPARAKKTKDSKLEGGKFGGQEASRALLGIPKSSDIADFDSVITLGIVDTLEVMSDSSEEDSEEEIVEVSSSGNGKESKGSRRKRKRKRKR